MASHPLPQALAYCCVYMASEQYPITWMVVIIDCMSYRRARWDACIRNFTHVLLYNIIRKILDHCIHALSNASEWESKDKQDIIVTMLSFSAWHNSTHMSNKIPHTKDTEPQQQTYSAIETPLHEGCHWVGVAMLGQPTLITLSPVSLIFQHMWE